MAVQTANTIQTGSSFLSVNWIDEEIINQQLNELLSNYEFNFVKIGLVPSSVLLDTLVTSCQNKNKKTKIIWDPVLSASVGYDFGQNFKSLINTVKKLHMITPNHQEIKNLSGLEDPIAGAKKLSEYCLVLLKGGHDQENPGQDILYINGEQIKFKPKPIKFTEKHGTGCVLASALTANLAKGYPIRKSILRSKRYIEQFIESNSSLIGSHQL